MADFPDTKKIQFQTIVASLPLDIISNILIRLTVEDVTRFKSVNKSWCNLISSPYFSHQHYLSQPSHFQDRIVVFVGRDDGSLYFSNLDISDSFNPKKINLPRYIFKDVIGCCNGLLLCTCNFNVNDDPKKISLVLVNPSTLRHKIISMNEVSSVCGTHCYGFGYDFKADDYKVVRIVKQNIESGSLKGCEIGVYSLKSDCWKIIDDDFDGGFFFPWNGVLINNHVLHWFFYIVNGHVIRSFDLCTEQWSEVPLPAFDMSGSPVSIIGFDERLCLLTLQPISVFVMDEYCVRDSWVRLFDSSGEIYSNGIFPYPIFYSKSGNEILVVVGSRFFWYNSTQKTWREIQGHNVFHFSARLVTCTRSLVRLPNCG